MPRGECTVVRSQIKLLNGVSRNGLNFPRALLNASCAASSVLLVWSMSSSDPFMSRFATAARFSGRKLLLSQHQVIYDVEVLLQDLCIGNMRNLILKQSPTAS
eukprot:IDg20420t1